MPLLTKTELQNTVARCEPCPPEIPSGHIDIYIVNNSEDCSIPRGLRSLLNDAGFSVYIGQCDNRDEEICRKTMERSSALLYLVYLTSGPFEETPWPLSFMKELNKRSCVVPVLSKSLSLYGIETLWNFPYLDRTEREFYIHRNSSSWISLSQWLKGGEPALFNANGKFQTP